MGLFPSWWVANLHDIRIALNLRVIVSSIVAFILQLRNMKMSESEDIRIHFGQIRKMSEFSKLAILETKTKRDRIVRNWKMSQTDHVRILLYLIDTVRILEKWKMSEYESVRIDKSGKFHTPILIVYLFHMNYFWIIINPLGFSDGTQ